MGEFLNRLFSSDFMPHGACWGWEPWVVWWNVVPDLVIVLCYTIIPLTLFHVARRRKDVSFDWLVMMFAVFNFSCGCTHGLEVYNTWHGMFRLAGVVKAVTACASLMTTFFLLRIAPKLVAVPGLNRALAMDAALSSEQREKTRVEGQLREVRDRYQHIMAGIRDYSIILLDPDGRITDWNPGAELITGYAAGEIMGEPLSRFFPDEDVADGKPQRLSRTAAEQGCAEDEGLRVRKGGERYTIHVVVTPFYNAAGGLQGFVNIARDVTEQKATQTALRNQALNLENQVRAQVQELHETQGKLEGFIRHAPAAIAFKGLDGRFLLINPRMEALLGRPSADILDRTCLDLFPPEVGARMCEQDRKVLDDGVEIQEEEQWPDQAGTLRHYLCHKFPLADATGRCWGVGFIATDITERKQADLALLQRQKLESLGVLSGGIAHDFKNLLGAMQGHVELAMTGTSLEAARPHHETLLRLMAKGADLLRQMLAYAGQGRSNVRIIDLNRQVEEMTRLLGTTVSKKASIRMQLDPRPLPLAADPSQIQQVIMNLVINASEALDDRSGIITIRTGRAEVSRADIDGTYEGQRLEPGPHVTLEVSDNGVGMSPEVQKRIFDPFFTTKFAGRGLGLAAIHGIVRGHRGGIKVCSKPGQGTTFKLLFPAATSPVPAEPSILLPPPPAAAAGGRLGTILVADDEDEIRAVAVATLKRAGFRTLQAGDGREVLDLFLRDPGGIRLIFLDLTMPRLDGEEACRELRRRGATVPVILSSGFSQVEIAPRFVGLGPVEFLQKPFALGTLVETVRRLLSG